MKIEFIKPKDSMYEEFYNWRSDDFAIAHNPFAECDYQKFKEIMAGFSSNLDELYTGKDFKWAIIDEQSILSLIGISQVNKMMKTAEIAYQVSPNHRGQGLGTKIVQEFVKYVLQNTDLRKIVATIADSNIPSCKVVERAGFKQEGLLRKHFLINGIPTDERVYGLLREEV